MRRLLPVLGVERETPFVTRFQADPGYHTPDVTKNQHYAPFRQLPDPDVASDVIANKFVGDPDVQKMLEQPTTWTVAQWKSRYEGEGDETSVALAMLQSLVGTAIDPLMAKILGLYFYADPAAGAVLAGGDIKVEAKFPFFLDKNLQQLELELRALAPGFSLKFLLDNSNTLLDTSLCGLILGPKIDEKPGPAEPQGFTTAITVTDVPSQVKADSLELLADAEIKWVWLLWSDAQGAQNQRVACRRGC